jgi:hypothetical protein
MYCVLQPNGCLQFGAKTANNRIAPPSANGGVVGNVFEERDEPGEWFHGRKGAWIYYHAQDGKRPPAAGFRAGNLEAQIRIEGRRAPVQNIPIENASPGRNMRNTGRYNLHR